MVTYATKESDCEVFVIRTMGPKHACGRAFYHKNANSRFLDRYFMEFLRLSRNVTWSAFKEKVHQELNVHITKEQAYKTFRKAKILIQGNYKQQYTMGLL